MEDSREAPASSAGQAAKPRREDLDKLTLADLLLEHVQSDTREQRAKRRGFKEFLERQLGYPLDVDDLFSLRGFAASRDEEKSGPSTGSGLREV